MDGSRFDQLARSLVTRTDRRRALRGVSGVVAAVLGTSLGVELTAAKRDTQDKRRKQRKARAQDSPQRKCKQASRPCSYDTHCCSRSCCNKICCGPDEQCNLNGECVCKADNVAACAGRECGAATNNCDQTVNCGPLNGGCPQGKVCNASGACAYDAGTCALGDRTCGATGVLKRCNGDTCNCWRTVSGGTVCGGVVECTSPCSTDADCAPFGPRSACVDVEGCQCTSTNEPKVCARPCDAEG
jgi:hypothetical protein